MNITLKDNQVSIANIAQHAIANPELGTLAVPLASALFTPLDKFDSDNISAGHTVQVMKKRGDNSRLLESLAVEVPEFTRADVLACIELYPVLVGKFIKTLYDEQREIIVTIAAKGAKLLQYSDITLQQVAAKCIPVASVSTKLSADSIKSWYESTASDVMTVYISTRLGLADSEEISDADMIKIGQISNQVRDNLAKLASPNPVYAEPVHASLNRALNALIAAGVSDSMMDKMLAKLNKPAVADINLMEML